MTQDQNPVEIYMNDLGHAISGLEEIFQEKYTPDEMTEFRKGGIQVMREARELIEK